MLVALRNAPPCPLWRLFLVHAAHVAAALGLLVLVATAAFAQTAAPASNQVAAGAAIVFIEPYLKALLDAVVTFVAIPVIVMKVNAWLKVDTTAKDWEVVHSAADAAAQRWWAANQGNVAHLSVTVGSAVIAAHANEAIATIPQLATKLGVTPADMAQLVVSKIGKMQAAAGTSAPAAEVN